MSVKGLIVYQHNSLGEFKSDANAKFTSFRVTDPQQEEILIPIPWNYPEESNNDTRDY